VRKIKILVVDKHAVIRDGIRALIGLHDDLEVVGEASEGKEAVEKAQELAPDVVVMDTAIPGMDGLEATRRIKKKNPKTQVLVLTQFDDNEHVLSAIRAGASGYVPKKENSLELLSAIRTMYKGYCFLCPSAVTALIDDYRQLAEEIPYDRLTAREREILVLLTNGLSSRQVAEMLLINPRTVHGHQAKIMGKLDIHNRTELIKYALRKGLITV